MIDVTDVPNVKVGDSVEIFGEDNPVGILAAALDTIPYELLTAVSPRVRRVYYSE
jgi:alanine racemase